MVAGNRAVIPDSLLKGVRTLTSNIVLEMGYATDLHREALIATAMVLFVFILIINVLFSILKGRNKSNEPKEKNRLGHSAVMRLRAELYLLLLCMIGTLVGYILW